MAASGAGGAITEVRLSPEKGRCLFVAEAVAAGSVCLAERPLVASSPAAAGQLWDHLCSGGSRLGTLACDPQWCLAALTAGGGRGRGSAPGQLWRTSSSPRGGASQRLGPALGALHFNAFRLPERGALGLYAPCEAETPSRRGAF
ncbi:unnamed protein product [Prorocentrum cordatum]|uniref:Uncharacterized protein n=1 Tax=Prorocentrum cordatum TaxID=2364126 RepID=A0ABN9WLP3_9DINO|nr:unnamed protein product [Polarella glacialis]